MSVIPGLLEKPLVEEPVAEVWLGAHPDGPASVGVGTPIVDDSQLYPSWAPPGSPLQSLTEWTAQDPQAALGESAVERYRTSLPYLFKVIVPVESLSFRVHPSIEQAEEGLAAKKAAGVPRSAPDRNYKDRNHKPEPAYVFTAFEALVGFRARCRIGEILRSLDTPLVQCLRAVLGMGGVHGAFEYLLCEWTRPSPEEVAEVAEACVARLVVDSPPAHADCVVATLFEHCPGDPGVVASLLMNPVILNPGEALFPPADTVHAYLSDVAVEITAALDNVLRVRPTHKYADVPESLTVLNFSASLPTRIAPECVNAAVLTLYASVDDFEFSGVRLRDVNTRVWVRRIDPRTVLCLRGAAQLEVGGRVRSAIAGQAVFILASDGQLIMCGIGHLV